MWGQPLPCSEFEGYMRTPPQKKDKESRTQEAEVGVSLSVKASLVVVASAGLVTNRQQRLVSRKS